MLPHVGTQSLERDRHPETARYFSWTPRGVVTHPIGWDGLHQNSFGSAIIV